MSDLRIIFFIREHVCTIHNILLMSITNVTCPLGRHRKIKLLEFSVKGLRMPGVINIRITSVCNPQSVCNVLTASVHVLESSVRIKTWKMYTDIHGGCSEAVRMLPEVYGHYRKPQRSIGMVLGEGHGYEICPQIIRRCIRTMGMGIMDGKDVSRTIRTGFTDTFVVSHSTRELMERRFVMDKTLYKGHWAWLLLIFTFDNSMCKHQFLETFTVDTVYV